MTQFMLAHPWLFTFQVGFVSVVLASALSRVGGKIMHEGDIHHHYHNHEGDE